MRCKTWEERWGKTAHQIPCVVFNWKGQTGQKKNHISKRNSLPGKSKSVICLKNFWDLFPGLPCFLGQFLHGTSTSSQTRAFPEQALTWTGMMPLFLRTRGSFSKSPSNSFLKSSRGFPLLLRRTGRRTVTRGRFPSPLISKVRLCALIVAGLQERQRRNH